MTRAGILILCLVRFVLTIELLKNPGFESPDLSNNWHGWGFSIKSETSDVHGGTRAVLVSSRHHSYQGPAQVVPIKPGARYSFSSSVKQLNDHPGKIFQTFRTTIAYTWADTGKTDYYIVAYHPDVQASTGWFSLDGDFSAPDRSFSRANLYFEGPDPDINFLVDDTSLQPVDEDTAWQAEANTRIENIRKSHLNIRTILPPSLKPRDVTVKIDHRSHLFGFGSMINEDWMTHDSYKQYQNLVYSWFNWVTAGSFKWKYNRGTKDHPDYKVATDAVRELDRRGLKVRGHNMFWGVPGNSPAWVEALNGTMLEQTITERVQYMTNITKGLLAHWDVNNELLHGQLYEEKTGDPLYSEKIYNMVHQADPGSKLFLNDYDVVAVGAVTDAYVTQANEFKNANVGLYGLGLQSHFRAFTPPDPTLLKMRLDKLASTGLPLWITEMDLIHHNETTRADWYERALRTYFSHPAVEGVIFWGFWDDQINPYAALVNGKDFYVNAAGQRFIDLVKKEWSTHVNRSLASGLNFSLRGFHGDYDIVVEHKGSPILYLDFHLGKSDATVTLNVSAHASAVTLPSTVDPYQHVTQTVSVAHNNEHVVGRASSRTSLEHLECVTRWSPASKSGDDQSSFISCQRDEILTGCSSTHDIHHPEWYRDGEKIEMKNGRAACVAVDGWRSTDGIQAVARCCKTKNLHCTYRQSGPTAKQPGAEVETTCGHRETATGCSAYNWNSEFSGAFPSANRRGCIAENEELTAGTYSFAACCMAPRLTCKTVVSSPSGHLQGNLTTVSCDTGYVMMGCNVRANFGKSAGAFIGGRGNQSQVWYDISTYSCLTYPGHSLSESVNPNFWSFGSFFLQCVCGVSKVIRYAYVHVCHGKQGSGEWCMAVNGREKFPGEQGVLAVAVCCALRNSGTIIG